LVNHRAALINDSHGRPANALAVWSTSIVGCNPKPRKTPGPKPKVAKIEGDWKNPIKKAVKKKHPDAGWPED
jgi:hypothetical protein